LDWQRQYDSYRRKKALVKIERAMMEASLNDCQEKFIAGRLAYGGEFKPESIAHEIEIQQEALDTQNYSDMQEFLIWKDDPVSFHEFASQYIQ